MQHRQAKGMQAALRLLKKSARMREGVLAPDGGRAARAAAALLEAILEAAPQAASEAFCDEGGFVTVRCCVACAHSAEPQGLQAWPPNTQVSLACVPLGEPCGDRDVHRLLFEGDSRVQVAEAALCVLSTLLLKTKMRADTKRMLCHAVVASQLHQALLAFLRTSPRSSGACKVLSWYPSLSVEPVEFAAIHSFRMPLC